MQAITLFILNKLISLFRIFKFDLLQVEYFWIEQSVLFVLLQSNSTQLEPFRMLPMIEKSGRIPKIIGMERLHFHKLCRSVLYSSSEEHTLNVYLGRQLFYFWKCDVKVHRIVLQFEENWALSHMIFVALLPP